MLESVFMNWLQTAVPLLLYCFRNINNHKGSIALGVLDQMMSFQLCSVSS